MDAEQLGPVTAESELVVPPVRTVTWYHTGAWLEHGRLEAALAAEYYVGDAHVPRLSDTVVPPGLTIDEERDAARALAGRMLRQEVYTDDGTAAAVHVHPYAVQEHGHLVRLVEQAGERGPAVFHVITQDVVAIHYERHADNTRISHQLVLSVAGVGNITERATIGYPRRVPATPEQSKLWIAVEASTFSNRDAEPDWYRVGVPRDERVDVSAAQARGLVGVEERADRRRVCEPEAGTVLDDATGERGGRIAPLEVGGEQLREVVEPLIVRLEAKGWL